MFNDALDIIKIKNMNAINEVQGDHIGILKSQLESAQATIKSLQKDLKEKDKLMDDMQQDIEDLEDELTDAQKNKDQEYYKNLLAKPMREIAEADGNFKKAYEEQMLFMAEWMVSQKAFKEVAIELGEKQGLNSDEVINMGVKKEIEVLENRNNPSHKTNANDGNVIPPRKEKLKEINGKKMESRGIRKD